MYLIDWKKSQAKGEKQITWKELAHRFGISDGSIIRRWTLDAHDKNFNFPSPENIINVQTATLGEVTSKDFYDWFEGTKTKKKSEEFHANRTKS